MRTPFITVGIALLAMACGGAPNPGLGGDGGSGGGSSSGGSSGGGSSSGGSSSGGAGCGDPPPEHCVTGCNGGVTGPECIDGSWVCPPEPEIACPVDAGSGADSGSKLSGDGGIDCVTTTCNAATEYCNISGGGAVRPDGGSNMSYECLPLPTMPCDAGTGCACIPDRCGCTDDGGYITNECLYP